MKRPAVLAPPVITPSEVPAGAFMLAAGLMARGIEAPIHDLSLGFFRWLFLEHAEGHGYPNCRPALEYLKEPDSGLYSAHKHRSVCGVLQSALKKYSTEYPGWQLSLMDSVPPGAVHSTSMLTAMAAGGGTPFSKYLIKWLEHNRDTFDHALISLAYISQLPASVELARLLKDAGKRVTVGGSLPSALKTTGRGIELLDECFEELVLDDGRSLLDEDGPFLSRIDWPVFALDTDYLSCRPVVPLPLTTGCVWNRCLFCPDRDKPFMKIPVESLEKILKKAPGNSVVHLIDSAIPVERLTAILPILADMTGGFYGFARPEGSLLDDGLLERYKKAGCLMLQTGAESGSEKILRRFAKGFLPQTAETVIRASSDAGILNYVYLLFGLPEETDMDRDMTLNMVRRLENCIDYMNISVFNLPERSELTERAEEFGILPGEYDSASKVLRFYRPFTCSNGCNPRSESREYLRTVFRQDPAVSRILLRTPKWFRAGHMALMNPEAGIVDS